MSKLKWSDHVGELCGHLKALSCRNAEGQETDPEDGLQQWRKLALDLRAHRGTVYLVGNGASASMASHMAADLAKNAQLHTQVFSDLSLITAISNDMGYEHVFSEPLSRRAQAGDMLVAISSSGESRNVLAAVDVANKHGMFVITLSAMKEDNSLRKAGRLNFYVPAPTFGYAESCHAAILHHWMDMVEVSG
jgi:D-sedoheptulose 7-phosphate isomerase